MDIKDMETKKEVAIACRALYLEGHGDTNVGHVSIRSDDGRIFIKPAGLGLEEVTPDDIQVMDEYGNKLEGPHKVHNELVIHTEIYKARPEVKAVIHTHPIYATCLASVKNGFELISHDSVHFAGNLPVFSKTPDLLVTEAQGCALAEALGMAKAILIKNHGIVTVGTSIGEALFMARSLEKSARMIFIARSLGDISPMDPAVAMEMDHKFQQNKDRINGIWNYYRRMVERLLPFED
jgi:L-ribulose-5-phosphate 4-epimerase